MSTTTDATAGGSPASMDDIHRLLGIVLKELDRVCQQLGIRYAVYGGTAIGAVRHQGFIPWDDDADVLMPRPDYERFLREAPAVMAEGFSLHNTRTVPEFPFMFTKMVLDGTLLIPEFLKDADYRMPFFVDVLPLDFIPDDAGEVRRMSRASWLWGRLLFLQGIARPYLIGVPDYARRPIHAATTVVHHGLRAAHVTTAGLQRRWDAAVRRYETQPTGRLTDFTMRDTGPWTVTMSELFPAQRVPFEDFEVMLPKEYDRLLRRGYGDYMTLPPEDQRRNHVPWLVDLGPYASRPSQAEPSGSDQQPSAESEDTRG